MGRNNAAQQTRAAPVGQYLRLSKFEILLDGKTQTCRDTMLTAMGLQN